MTCLNSNLANEKAETQSRQSRPESELFNFCYIASSVAIRLMDRAILQLKILQSACGIKYKLISLIFLALCNPALLDTSSSIYH